MIFAPKPESADFHRFSRSVDRRSAFTLMELLLVLAILFMVAAMSVPMLQRSFAVQKLKSNADQVRAAFGRARVHAIRTGDVYAFFYRPGTNQYVVTRFKNSYTDPAASAIANEFREEEELSENIDFVASKVLGDSRSQMVIESALSNLGGMSPILFYPDGTSQDAQITIKNEKDQLIQVNLRGLTSLASMSDVLGMEDIQ